MRRNSKRVDEQQAWLEKERQKHEAERELAAAIQKRRAEKTHEEIRKWAEKLAKPDRAAAKKELARRAAAALSKPKLPAKLDGIISTPEHRQAPSSPSIGASSPSLRMRPPQVMVPSPSQPVRMPRASSASRRRPLTPASTDYGDQVSRAYTAGTNRNQAVQHSGMVSTTDPSTDQTSARPVRRPSSAGAAIAGDSSTTSHTISTLEVSPAIQARLLELRNAIDERPWLPLSVKLSPYQRLLSERGHPWRQPPAASSLRAARQIAKSRDVSVARSEPPRPLPPRLDGKSRLGMYMGVPMRVVESM